MSSTEIGNKAIDVTAVAPNIYLNSDMIGKVCLLSAEQMMKNSVPASCDRNGSACVSSIPDDVIHCSLPNLSPVHHVSQTRKSGAGGLHKGGSGFNGHRLCNRHTVCYGSVSMVHTPHRGTGSHSINAYCSPRTGRKQRPGSISTKDLSCLRAECYLKCKHQGIRGSRTRLDSGNSADSDHGTIDSASHISTCATSDYAYMTSMDTIAMLCKECQKCSAIQESPGVHDNLTPALSEMDFCSSLRRTHSNPENCNIDFSLLDNDKIRDSRSCSELNDPLPSSLNYNNRSNVVTSDNDRFTNMTNKNIQMKRGDDSEAGDIPGMTAIIENTARPDRSKASKSIAISEENLVSRVSRWLSTVDHNGAALETDIF